jgi:serine/threonine protein phosphatase PrpC
MNVYGLSDVGRVRSNNEDHCRFEKLGDEQAIFVVCDGMGGARAGQIASEIASAVFIEQLRGYIREKMSVRYMESVLNNAISFANYDTYKMANSDPQYHGMGTTLVGGIYHNGQVILANIGDSRAYLFDGEGLRQLTRDHSFVEELVQRGEITEEQARRHPRKNIITRAMGPDRKPKADIYPFTMEPGQKLLLCSDGLSNMLEEGQMEEILTGGDLETVCKNLICAANENGGTDNITVLVLHA